MRRVLSLFSRGGHTGAFGKLDDELGNIRIASITKEKLTVLATEVGMPLSEYVRTVLDGHAHGPGHVERLAVERVRRVLGNVE